MKNEIDRTNVAPTHPRFVSVNSCVPNRVVASYGKKSSRPDAKAITAAGTLDSRNHSISFS